MNPLTPEALAELTAPIERLVAEMECAGGPVSPYFQEPDKFKEHEDWRIVVAALPALIQAARERLALEALANEWEREAAKPLMHRSANEIYERQGYVAALLDCAAAIRERNEGTA